MRQATPADVLQASEEERRLYRELCETYERLSAVKAAYDPDNLFHVNQNIAPAKRR